MENTKSRRIKSLWETFRDIVAVLSGLTLVVGLAAYVGNLVIAYLYYIIAIASAIFIVSLAFVIGARFKTRRQERAMERVEEEARSEQEVLEGTPVCVVRQGVTIGEYDPIATGLRHMVIPLNKRPNAQWIRCFENMPVVYLFLQEAIVVGGSIETTAAEDAIPQTVDAITDLVIRTNQEYVKSLEEQEERAEREKTRSEAEDRRRRDLESKARNQGVGPHQPRDPAISSTDTNKGV